MASNKPEQMVKTYKRNMLGSAESKFAGDYDLLIC